jgi:bilirubin oxidase
VAIFPAAEPGTTGQVMKFAVVPLVSQDSSLDSAKANFKLPAVTSLGPATNTRQVSLNEQASNEPFGGPIAALLGTLDPFGPIQLGWADPITENPALNSIEIWEM